MTKRYQGTFYKEHKKLFQKVNNSSRLDKVESSAKPIEKWTLFLSLLAIIVSGISLYFQFFYEKNDLRAYFISAGFENDSAIVSTIIYHNKGNTYSTVLGNAMVFYQDTTDIENKSFQFNENKHVQYYNEKFDPIVLAPGQQLYRDVRQFLAFERVNYKSLLLDPKSKIKVALAISYIKESGFYSTNFIPVGWISLDSAFHIDDYYIYHKMVILNSDSVYISHFKRKIK